MNARQPQTSHPHAPYVTTHLQSTIHLTFCLHYLLSVDPLDICSSSLSQQHKSHVAEPSHSRPLNDRKRKFVDTELAQDTEGNVCSCVCCFNMELDWWKTILNIDDCFDFQNSSKTSVSCRRSGLLKVSSVFIF